MGATGDARGGGGAFAGRRVALVANPASGGGRARRAERAVVAALRAHGAAVETIWSAGPGGVGDAVRRGCDARADVVALLGGDGTLHEALPALLEARAPLAFLPCGGGNDFARALGLPRDPVAAAGAAGMWSERAVDLGAAGGRPFATVAASGFDAEVAAAVRGARVRLPGSAAYVAAAVATLARYRARRLRLSGVLVPHEPSAAPRAPHAAVGARSLPLSAPREIEGAFLLIAAANSASYGGGMRIAPDARIDDGLLDFCLVDEVSRTTVLRLLPKMFDGAHAAYPFVRFVRASRVDLAEAGTEGAPPAALFADGEPAGRLPIALSVLPGALRVIAPGGASDVGFPVAARRSPCYHAPRSWHDPSRRISGSSTGTTSF